MVGHLPTWHSHDGFQSRLFAYILAENCHGPWELGCPRKSPRRKDPSPVANPPLGTTTFTGYNLYILYSIFCL